jgi:hypothetical protein
MALFIAAGLLFADWGRFSSLATPGYAHFSASVLLLVYAFTGFEMALIPSEEIRDPQRNIPLALMTAISLVACVYPLIHVRRHASGPRLFPTSLGRRGKSLSGPRRSIHHFGGHRRFRL